MLTENRKHLILSRLSATGQVIARDLAAELGLSEDTIRRDLRELAADGRLLRVHGGALPASPAVAPLDTRRGIATPEKAALARTAAALVTPGQTVFIDGGTTHAALVAALPLRLRATVITHSPTIAGLLEPFTGIEVLLIGGRLYRHSMVATGADALDAIRRVRTDLAFVGVTGLHPGTGLTTGDSEEAAIKRAIIAQAADCAVIATADKIGAASPWQIAPLDAATILVVPPAARPRLLPHARAQMLSPPG
jgi:DeoR/GlpR family transcriptional regulator of sugar metabolism